MMDQKTNPLGRGARDLGGIDRFLRPASIFKLVIVAVVGLCLKEFMNMPLPKHPTSAPNLGIVLGIFFSGVLLFAKGGSQLWIGSLSLIVVVTFVYYLFSDHDLSIVLSQIGLTVFGCVYVACLFLTAAFCVGFPTAFSGFFYLRPPPLTPIRGLFRRALVWKT
mgnify:CR=1 FL=1